MHNFVLSPIDLEKLISSISERVTANILKAVQSNDKQAEQHEQLLTIQEAAEFLSLTGSSMYSKVLKSELPVFKLSKRLYFSHSALLEYLKEWSKKANTEVQMETKVDLLNNKKGCIVEKNQDNSLLSNENRQVKVTQLIIVYNAFYEKPRTMKEVFVCTGVLREFVCWYCRELRLSGRLHFIKKRKCSITGKWVKEFTTNEKLIPEFPKQLKLF